jgi:hypothetical protein
MASQRPFSSLCEILRVATIVAGMRDRVTDWISAGQQSNFQFVAWRILANQSASSLQSGDYGRTLKFWQRVFREKDKKALSTGQFGNIMAASRM